MQINNFFLIDDATIIKFKRFSSMSLRNKNDQYCDRSVVFSTLWFYRSWGNSFSLAASNISNSFERCCPFISLSSVHFKISMWLIAASSFCSIVSNIPTQYLIPMFFVATSENMLVHVSTACINRIADTVVRWYNYVVYLRSASYILKN